MVAARGDHAEQPLVLRRVDLAAGQSLVQDPARAASALAWFAAAAPGGTGAEGVPGPDQQAQERDHPDPNEGQPPRQASRLLLRTRTSSLPSPPGPGCAGPLPPASSRTAPGESAVSHARRCHTALPPVGMPAAPWR